MRHALLVLCAGLTLLAAPLRAQALLYTFPTQPMPFANYGGNVAAVPDADGDGIEDVAVLNGGGVDLYSGATGALLHALRTGDACCDDVAGVPDVDGDGRGEVAVVTSFAGIRLASGATGALLRTFPDAWGDPGTVAGLADVTGDGRGDIAAGCPPCENFFGQPWAGTVTFFDGVTGDQIGPIWTGAGGYVRYGSYVAAFPDRDGDGLGEVLTCANGSHDCYLGSVPGTASPPGPFAYPFTGRVAEAVPDTDGDGIADLIVGWIQVSAGVHGARLYSGSTQALLHTFSDPQGSGQQFSRAVAGVPDVDGDGRGDVLLRGASGSDAVHLFSGATGALVATVEAPVGSAGGFGAALAGFSDLDGDGRGDFAVASDAHVYVFSGAVAVASEPGLEEATAAVHPNPATREATVAFVLAAPAPVRLVLHDVLGREVTAVDAGRLGAGPHRLPLDVSMLPAGVYVWRLAADGPAGARVEAGRLTVAR